MRGSSVLSGPLQGKILKSTVSSKKGRIPGPLAVIFGENIVGIDVTFSNNPLSASQCVCLILTMTKPVK